MRRPCPIRSYSHAIVGGRIVVVHPGPVLLDGDTDDGIIPPGD
ncbi:MULTISPECIES: hypothetical protein [unclassified Pseudonocardia]|nr:MULTISPECIES: hypothetical protein [unclassified Pseudonocardia]